MEENNSPWDPSILVLKELEKLNRNYESLREDIYTIKNDITKVKGMQYSLDELKEWKKKVDEVISPSQLAELKKEVEEGKLFRARMITIFVVVQTVMGIVMALIKLL